MSSSNGHLGSNRPKRITTHPLREARRKAARVRQIARDALGPAQQADVLDARLGAGEGAVSERDRLLHQRVAASLKARGIAA